MTTQAGPLEVFRTIETCLRMAAHAPNAHHFQQNPIQTGCALAYLLPHRDGLRTYLEIGAGAGLFAAMVAGMFDLKRIYTIDDNHFDFSQESRDRVIPGAVQFVGDSTSEVCKQMVRSWGVRFDLVMVDADHSYVSAKSDTLLALSVAADPCWFIFHNACWVEPDGGVHKWLPELVSHEWGGFHVEEHCTCHNVAIYKAFRKIHDDDDPS